MFEREYPYFCVAHSGEKECLAALLENFPMLVYMKDINRNYIIGSKHSAKFYYDGVDLYSGNIHLNLSEASESIILDDKFVIENKETLIKEKSFSDVNGEIHWYKIYKSPVINSKSEVEGIVTVAQNIDNDKFLENQRDIFIATLSHDLKNPLLAQISSLNLLAEGLLGNLNNNQKEMVEMIIESAKYMQEMLFAILSTYKYSNGILKLEKQYIDINKFINICIKETTGLAMEKGIKIVYNSFLSSENKNLYADETQLRRVVSNLINNAVSYAYKNSGLVIETYYENEKIIFSFENTSEPISDEMKRKIFDKYVSNANKYEKVGFGLGMYLCKKVIEAHNGRIFLISEGTKNKFIFELPCGNEFDETASIIW